MNVLVFDIETIPDTATGEKLYGLEGLSPQEIGQAMFAQRAEQTGGSDFLPHYLHRVVAISAVFRHGNQFKVWSLGDEQADEAEIIQRFFEGIEKYVPTIVSWNGGGFDLPVLHYRSLLHGISAPRYWDMGDDEREFRFNNYINRFHLRHIDLMDVLSGYQGRATAPLDNISLMLGFPGKMGQSGGGVWEQYLAGDIVGIRNYCETDVLNTYLVYLQWEKVRGNLTDASLQSEHDLVASTLRESDQAHLLEFLSSWENNRGDS